MVTGILMETHIRTHIPLPRRPKTIITTTTMTSRTTIMIRTVCTSATMSPIHLSHPLTALNIRMKRTKVIRMARKSQLLPIMNLITMKAAVPT